MKWLLPLLWGLWACNGTMESYFAQDVVDETLDQPYADGKNLRQYLDLFTPRDATGYPIVVFVHGGYWIHQDRDYFESVTGLYRNVGIALARHGIGVATISYRLVPDVPFEDELDDVALATQWTHDHIAEHGGDPARIVIAGHSAGGHIAALLAVDEDRLASRGVDPAIVLGYIALSPIVDLAAMAASSADHAQIAAEVFGDALAEYSPVTYPPPVKPELFGLGTQDEPFIAAQVPPYVATLGAPLVAVQGATHDDMVLNFDSDDDQLTAPIVAFVNAL